MLFKWSSGGKDIRYLDLSIRSLHQFYPNEQYVVCYNGPPETLDKFKQQIEHLPLDRIIVVWDYCWPFDFRVSAFWNKYVPPYLEEFGGTQFHIDNDILFVKKPSRLEGFKRGIYLTPELDHEYPCNLCCFALKDIMIERKFTPVNSGIYGLEAESYTYFRDQFYKFADNLYHSGVDMHETSEQATLALFAQDKCEAGELDIHWETADYFANAYSLQRYVDNLHTMPWVTIHFMSMSKVLFENFYGFFAEHIFNWNARSLEMLQSLLRVQELGTGIYNRITRKDRKVYQICLEKESGLTDPNSPGIIDYVNRLVHSR